MGFKKTGTAVNVRTILTSPSIVITEIPSDQPMVYASGFRSGLFGPEVDREGRSSVWLKGFEHGLKVRDGSEEAPPWLISEDAG